MSNIKLINELPFYHFPKSCSTEEPVCLVSDGCNPCSKNVCVVKVTPIDPDSVDPERHSCEKQNYCHSTCESESDYCRERCCSCLKTTGEWCLIIFGFIFWICIKVLIEAV